MGNRRRSASSSRRQSRRQSRLVPGPAWNKDPNYALAPHRNFHGNESDSAYSVIPVSGPQHYDAAPPPTEMRMYDDISPLQRREGREGVDHHANPDLRMYGEVTPDQGMRMYADLSPQQRDLAAAKLTDRNRSRRRKRVGAFAVGVLVLLIIGVAAGLGATVSGSGSGTPGTSVDETESPTPTPSVTSPPLPSSVPPTPPTPPSPTSTAVPVTPAPTPLPPLPSTCRAAPELLAPMAPVNVRLGEPVSDVTLATHFADFKLLRAVSFEQPPDTWAQPSGVAFPYYDDNRWGREDIPGAAFRCTSGSAASTVEQSADKSYSGQMAGKLATKELVSGASSSTCEMLADLANGISRFRRWDGTEAFFLGWAFWEGSETQLASYEMIHRFDYAVNVPGWGPQGNQVATLMRHNDTHYEYLVRVSYGEGIARDTLRVGFVPVRSGRWSRLVVKVVFHNDMNFPQKTDAPAGGWQGSIEIWSADGEQPDAPLESHGSLSNQRIGYVYAEPTYGPITSVGLSQGGLHPERVSYLDNLIASSTPGLTPADVDPINYRQGPGAKGTAGQQTTTGRLQFRASNLPPGLSLDPSTGSLSGVPSGVAGTFNVPMTVACTKGSTEHNLQINIT